jgi:PAS domain-containing protein
MVKTMKEKEEAVNKLRAELTVKQRNMEDSAGQESRSDPESVASSLTTSTTRSSPVNNLKAYQHQKRKAESEDSDEHKKRRKSTISSDSTNEDSSEDRGSRGLSAQSLDTDKTLSTVSDMTDSNRGSSSNNSGSAGSGSGNGRTDPDQPIRVSADEFTAGEQPSSSSISSDAAVASENSSLDRNSGSRNHHHKDVVFNNVKRAGLKRPPPEVTSLERSFELDYEEVFDNSNTPQLIAGTSGKIVTWNRCFLKATGLSRSDVERMTIFSLVKPNKLANFFEIVAEALRSNDDPSYPSSLRSKENPTDEDTKSAKSGNESNEPQGRQWNYSAMTLPCIDFPAMKARRAAGNPDASKIDPLHVTITLMTDQDPLKRCFHCTFTNCPGTDGALGTITPDLLAALFTDPESSKKKSSSRRKYKRARIQGNNITTAEESKSSQQQEEEPPMGEVG